MQVDEKTGKDGWRLHVQGGWNTKWSVCGGGGGLMLLRVNG